MQGVGADAVAGRGGDVTAEGVGVVGHEPACVCSQAEHAFEEVVGEFGVVEFADDGGAVADVVVSDDVGHGRLAQRKVVRNHARASRARRSLWVK